MAPLDSLTLLLNGLTLALSLSFLLITLWQDTRKELSQFFAIFLILVALWNGGSLLLQALSFTDNSVPTLSELATSMVEVGFAGSSIAIYTLTAVLLGIHTQRFRMLAMTSLLVVLGYQVLLIAGGQPASAEGLAGRGDQVSDSAAFGALLSDFRLAHRLSDVAAPAQVPLAGAADRYYRLRHRPILEPVEPGTSDANCVD